VVYIDSHLLKLQCAWETGNTQAVQIVHMHRLLTLELGGRFHQLTGLFANMDNFELALTTKQYLCLKVILNTTTSRLQYSFLSAPSEKMSFLNTVNKFVPDGIRMAAIFGATGILLGAFGSHALPKILEKKDTLKNGTVQVRIMLHGHCVAPRVFLPPMTRLWSPCRTSKTFGRQLSCTK